MCKFCLMLKVLFCRYDKIKTRPVKKLSGFKLLAVTLKLLKEKSQLLILPITMFIGAEQAFLFADYNAVSMLKQLSNLFIRYFRNEFKIKTIIK